ncbi:MAG TPA: hypothetical protein VN976_18760 [Verrucomicrobiae bacterium]|nr:hypothetical protein [Verrucomicrobiae bacterium]
MSLQASDLGHLLAHWNPSCLYPKRVANEIAGNRRAKRGEQGGNMSVTMLQSREVEESAEQKLWRAVIATTVEEWVSGPLRRKREAEQFLFSDNQDFQTVCFSAGINPENLRGRLEKIRARQIAEAQERASRN